MLCLSKDSGRRHAALVSKGDSLTLGMGAVQSQNGRTEHNKNSLPTRRAVVLPHIKVKVERRPARRRLRLVNVQSNFAAEGKKSSDWELLRNDFRKPTKKLKRWFMKKEPGKEPIRSGLKIRKFGAEAATTLTLVAIPKKNN